MNAFRLDVLEAERVFFKGECVSLVIPKDDGLYGIQANHHNTIVPVKPGVMKITTPDGTEIEAAVSSGIVKVENNWVLVLVETAELPEEIDVNRARRAEAAAKEAILQKRSIREFNEAQAHLARAVSRLRVKDRYEAKRGNRK